MMFNWKPNYQKALYAPLFQLLAAVVVGTLLGFSLTIIHPVLILIAVCGLLLAPAILKHPEFILLAILASLSTILDPEMLPAVPGMRSIKIVDLLLAASIGLVVLRWLAEPSFNLIYSPVNLPLFGFVVTALLSTLLAIIDGRVELWAAYEEFRIVSYYLTFFVVLNLIRDEQQLLILIRGFFLLATVVAVFMVLQFIIGDSVAILPGRVETLRTQSDVVRGITRILPPGQSIIQVTSITICAILVLRSFQASSLLWFMQWGLVTTAVIITFNRNFWVGIVLGISILATQVRGASWKRYVSWGMAVVAMGISGVGILSMQPNSQITTLASASVQRLLTVFAGGGALDDPSFQWRYPEYEHGLRQFTGRPILGIGTGVAYRPFDPRLDDPSSNLTRYLHNGHLWIAMKTGIVGYLFLISAVIIFAVRGFRNWRHINNPILAGTVLGFTLTTIGILSSNIVAPIFMQWFWTPIIGVMMGVNEVVILKYASQTDSATRTHQGNSIGV